MAKPTLLPVLLIALLLPALLCGVLFTLAGSETGTRLLAGKAREMSGGALDWRELHGALLGPLHIEGLRVNTAAADARVSTLGLDWSPGALLLGRLDIHSLSARGVTVTLKETETAEEESAALDPAALRPPLDIRLRHLDVSDITLQSADGAVQEINRVSLIASAEGEAISLQQLQLVAPQGGLEAQGRVVLDSTLPLELRVAWHWQLPDQRTLGGRLQADGNAERLRVSHRGEADLPVNLQGELRALLAQPGWAIELDWLALPLDSSDAPLVLGPGKLTSEGSLEHFSLAGDGRIEGIAAESLAWSLQADEGSLEGIRLAHLRLATAPGAIEFSGQLTWADDLAAELAYRASGRGLTAYHPDLPEQLDASGTIAARYSGETVQLQHFDLAATQSPLRLSLQGKARLPPDAPPAFEGQLTWREITWPLVPPAQSTGPAESPAFASPQGSLAVKGSSEDYRLTLDADTAGSQLPSTVWRAEGRGDRNGLRLDPLLAQLLDGELRLQGEIAWSPGIRWDLALDGESLDPGQWQPDLSGELTLALQTSGTVDPNTGPEGKLTLDHLRGTLSGQPFDLNANAAIAGESVDLGKLKLTSGQNIVEAQGTLSPEDLSLSWRLDAPEPGTLVPDAMGRLTGEGAIGGTMAQPRVRASIAGDKLARGSQSLERLRANIQLGLAADDTLALDLELANLVDGEETLLEAARLTGSGTSREHNLDIDATTPGDRIAARLAGGLDTDAMRWAGRLESLLLDTAEFGNWRLASPADMQLSAKIQNLEELCLTATDDAAALCASGHYAAAGNGQFAVQVGKLPLSRFSGSIDGELNGNFQGGLAANGDLNGSGRLLLSPGAVRLDTGGSGTSIAHRGGELTLAIDAVSGLQGEFLLDGDSQRLVEASVSLPRFGQLPLAAPQPLGGRLRADIDDLGGLPALVPQLTRVSGRLFADLQLAGTLDELQLQGTLALEDGAADIPMAGLELRQLALSIEGDPDRPGYLFLAGGATSGPGSVSLDGRLNLREQRFDLWVNGEGLEVWDTPDGRILLSPDLKLGWDGELASVRGRLEIPRADITPKLAISPGMASKEEIAETPQAQIIATSADVVILGPEGETVEEPAATLPFRLDSRVELALGERVRVNALGFNGRIAGTVTFINPPQRRELIPIADGSFSVEDGTFRAFGQDLEIETGRVIFARVPATEPELAVRAVRWIDNDPMVSAAGVQVTGPLDQPLMELFSRPLLNPAEIQSYLLFGHSANSEDRALALGTYVHPKLYVGYGYNRIAETSEFDALYTITPRYGIEATAGEADNRVNLTFTHER